MTGRFVGYVSDQDPLHAFLHRIMADHLGMQERHPAFRAHRMSGSNEVYSYEEQGSGVRVIGKFYQPRFGWDRDKAAWMASREYHGLKTLRGYDLRGSPHHVVRPLGFDREINCVLALEFYSGEELSHAIARSTHHGEDAHLFWRLKALAFFLATQHDRTADGTDVDFGDDCRYFGEVVRRLQDDRRIGQWDVDEFLWLSGLWRDRPVMWQDGQVWLHGDATPANFLFGHGMDVAAIDLERMKRGDRMFDVGRIAGELQHAFMVTTGTRERAQPFIGHFLREYSSHFPDRDRTFTSVTGRAPYYMALNLLRIAHNDYIDDEYGGRLVAEAKQLLRAA